MLVGLLALASLTGTVTAPTAPQRYRIEVKAQQEVDMSAMGGGKQTTDLGVIGFVVGKIAATLWAPVFPKFVLLLTQDALTGLLATLLICALASTLAIRAALRVDPATAIG